LRLFACSISNARISIRPYIMCSAAFAPSNMKIAKVAPLDMLTPQYVGFQILSHGRNFAASFRIP